MMREITRTIVEKANQLMKLKQYEDARLFFEQAADMGDDEAMYQLGILYTAGKGTKRNLSKALNYLHQSAQLGNAKAKDAINEHAKLQMLSMVSAPIETKPQKKVESIPEDPKAPLLYTMAKELFEQGQDAKAIVVLQEAAELGSGDAMYELGYRSTTGKGLPRDVRTGQKWIQKAAAAGNAKAIDLQTQMNMMNMNLAAVSSLSGDEFYARGRYKEALAAYLQKADVHSLCQAAFMMEKGYGTDINIEQAVSLYDKAVQMDSRYASRVLADWYYYGIHVQMDLKQASKYYAKGALLEDSYCEYMLKEKIQC